MPDANFYSKTKIRRYSQSSKIIYEKLVKMESKKKKTRQTIRISLLQYISNVDLYVPEVKTAKKQKKKIPNRNPDR